MPHTHKRLTAVMEGLGSYEIDLVFVDDGSRDNTLCHPKRIRWLRRIPDVKVAVDFCPEFWAAGGGDRRYARPARGRAVILIDADLQDPPETHPQDGGADGGPRALMWYMASGS